MISDSSYGLTHGKFPRPTGMTGADHSLKGLRPWDVLRASQEILKFSVSGNRGIPAKRPDSSRLQILSPSGNNFMPLIYVLCDIRNWLREFCLFQSLYDGSQVPKTGFQ